MDRPMWRGILAIASLYYFSRLCEVCGRGFRSESFGRRVAHAQCSFHDIRRAEAAPRRDALNLLPLVALDVGLLAALLQTIGVLTDAARCPLPSGLVLHYAQALAGGLYAMLSLGLFGHVLQLQFLGLAGLRLPALMRRPELATTLQDFWGHRWNTVVQAMLADNIYRPLRRLGAPRAVAVVAAFGASGSVHTYPLFVAGLGLTDGSMMMAYFISQAALLLTESALGLRSWFWVLAAVVGPAPLVVMPVYRMLGVPL